MYITICNNMSIIVARLHAATANLQANLQAASRARCCGWLALYFIIMAVLLRVMWPALRQWAHAEDVVAGCGQAQEEGRELSRVSYNVFSGQSGSWASW